MRNIVFVLPILSIVAFLHGNAKEYGIIVGKDDGMKGIFDSNAACSNTQGIVTDYNTGTWTNLSHAGNQDKCTAGYSQGWKQTCKQAYPQYADSLQGCPGISQEMIARATR